MLRLALQGREQSDQPGPALVRRQCQRLSVAERHNAETVSAPRRDVPGRDRDAVSDVDLAPFARAELHRRGRVEHKPCDEHSLGELDADMRFTRSRCHVPFDLAHVVAGDVRTNLGELDTEPVLRRAVVAGEHSFQPPPDLDLERVQKLERQRARSRPLGCRRPEERQVAHARGRARLMSGSGTAASTESRIASGVTPSASAW